MLSADSNAKPIPFRILSEHTERTVAASTTPQHNCSRRNRNTSRPIGALARVCSFRGAAGVLRAACCTLLGAYAATLAVGSLSAVRLSDSVS
jgi:hypothetical protein